MSKNDAIREFHRLKQSHKYSDVRIGSCGSGTEDYTIELGYPGTFGRIDYKQFHTKEDLRNY